MEPHGTKASCTDGAASRLSGRAAGSGGTADVGGANSLKRPQRLESEFGGNSEFE